MAPFFPLSDTRQGEKNAIPLMPQTVTGSPHARSDGRNITAIPNEQATDRNGRGSSSFGIPRKPFATDAIAAHRNSSDDLLSDQRKLPPEETSRRVKKSGDQLRLLQQWRTESLCCILVTGALLAMVATVYPYSGKPLPQWPYGLSINTLIAIYVTTLKTAMLFVVTQGLGQLKWDWFRHTRPLLDLVRYDDASRGPLGAVKLFWSLRRRCTIVTSVGGMLIILAAILDPFVQQIVHYYTCIEVVDGAPASIPRVNFFSDPGSIHIGAGLVSLGVGTQAAINAGAFSATAFSLPFNCASGNCTFEEPYWSIGYCSSCSDISDEVRRVNYTYFVEQQNRTDWILNWTLPSGVYVSPDDEGQVFALGGYLNNYDSSKASVTTIEAIYKLSDLASEGIPCNPDHPWRCKGLGAARCELVPCLKEYTAKVQGGFLHETFQGHHSEWGQTPFYSFNNVDMKCVTDSQKSLLREAGYQFKDTTRWLAYNVSVTEVSTDPADNKGLPSAGPGLLYYAQGTNYSNATLSIVPPECIYSYDYTSANTLAEWLASFLNGTVYEAPEVYYATAEAGSPTILLNIYNSGNVTLGTLGATLANITQSITSYIRQNGLTHLNNPAIGTATSNETCVRVRWAWLIFPAILVIATLVFFVAMIGRTSAGRDAALNHDFKSSVLPLMFHGLCDDERYLSGGELGKLSQMKRDAGSMWVRLSPTEKGWRFVEVDEGRDGL